jgi:hypothetical protein
MKMTVREAIERANTLRKNHPIEDETLQRWLRQADGHIRRSVIELCDIAEDEDATYSATGADIAAWDSGMDDEVKLLLPEPYDEAYVHDLCAQIDLALGETDRYMNEAQQYNNEVQLFAAAMRQKYKPRAKPQFRY